MKVEERTIRIMSERLHDLGHKEKRDTNIMFLEHTIRILEQNGIVVVFGLEKPDSRDGRYGARQKYVLSGASIVGNNMQHIYAPSRPAA